MEELKTLYPDYDVLAHQDEWDEHTREIINKRLGPFSYKTLSEREQEMVRALAQKIVYDDRKEILDWVLAHVDQELSQDLGEGDRDPQVPPQKELIKEGLRALDRWSREQFQKEFLELDEDARQEILSQLQVGQLPVMERWNDTLQKALFKKAAGLVVDAYYSHPHVWSEIGFGGPAYPRGYVRVELGLADPWEPPLADLTEEGGDSSDAPL